MPLPAINLHIDMIKAKLGTNTNDVDLICKHVNINKWSKSKPINHTKLFDLTDTDRKSKNYGLSFPYSDSNDHTIALSGWSYDRPIGGSSSPYRLDDFRNYYHASIPPLDITMLPILNVVNQSGVTGFVGDQMSSNIYQIGIDDFASIVGTNNIANSYFTVAMKKSTENLVYFLSAEDTIANNDTTILVNNNENIFNTSKLEVFFLLSSVKISSITEKNNLGFLRLWPIPSENGYIEFDVIRSFGDILLMNIQRISTTANGTYSSVALYDYYAYPIGDPMIQYFNVGGIAQGTVFLEVSVYNNDTASQTINASNIRMIADPLLDGSPSSNTSTPTMHNTSGTQISSITIPSKTSATFRLGVNKLLYEDTLPFPNTKNNVEIKLRYSVTGGFLSDWGQPINIYVTN